MIIVRIERWPDDADPEDARQRHRRTDIAQAVIKNDHTGSREIGNYDVEMYDPPSYNPFGGVERSGRVEDFSRRELGAWDLVFRSIGAAIENRSHEQDIEKTA